MKRIQYIVALAFSLAACSSPEVPDVELTLFVDKTEVDASGKDFVTFSLLDQEGTDLLLDKAQLQSINIVSDEGVRVPRMQNKVSFVHNGEYHFRAIYKGVKSKNVVTVVSKNRKLYEKYHKNVAIYKATATWCGPCAVMTSALQKMSDDSKKHSVELCWHYQDEFAFIFPGADYDCGTLMVSWFGAAGVPTVALDLKKVVTGRSAGDLNDGITQMLEDYPATCGIKLATEYADSQITADVELTSSTGGQYDIALAILLNNQIVPSGTNEGGKYSHIVKAASSNYLMYSPENITALDKDGKMQVSMDIPVGNINVDDISVAAYALVKDGERARIDNIVEVKLGESIDYIYNE